MSLRFLVEVDTKSFWQDNFKIIFTKREEKKDRN